MVSPRVVFVPTNASQPREAPTCRCSLLSTGPVSLPPRPRSRLTRVGYSVQVACAKIEFGCFMNTKQALRLMDMGTDPYPEVEGDDVTDQDREGMERGGGV